MEHPTPLPSLAVPLDAERIRAACRLHERYLPGWRESDAALERLRELACGADVPTVLLKLAAVDALYGTNVSKLYGLVPAANHIVSVLREPRSAPPTLDLVERIASVPPSRPGRRPPRLYSLASKFAHFFVDAEVFPIFDKYACEMVALHLGVARRRYEGDGTYARFVGDFKTLKSRAGWDGASRGLDRYLWLAGLRRTWRKRGTEAQLNAEVRALFENPPADAGEGLSRLDA